MEKNRSNSRQCRKGHLYPHTGAEALVIAGRPLVITLPLTFLFVEFTARASYLNPKEVWPEIPAASIALFSLAIIGFVFLAYYIGGKRVLRYSLTDALRDDTLA